MQLLRFLIDGVSWLPPHRDRRLEGRNDKCTGRDSFDGMRLATSKAADNAVFSFGRRRFLEFRKEVCE